MWTRKGTQKKQKYRQRKYRQEKFIGKKVLTNIYMQTCIERFILTSPAHL